MQSGELGSFSVSPHLSAAHLFFSISSGKKETLKEINKRGLYHSKEIQCFALRKLQFLNFLLPLFAAFRCGEEEEPSVWVCHTTGRLRGWFTSKARGELFVQANVLWMELSFCGQLIWKKIKKVLVARYADDVNVKKKKKSPICFASCQQAIVLEGSYWKRRIEVVIKEYHKWRIYHKKRVSCCFWGFFSRSQMECRRFIILHCAPVTAPRMTVLVCAACS